MKKTKILIGALSIAALAPTMPLLLTGCNKAGELTISLYANDGSFSDGAKSLILTNVRKGTKLKDIQNYVKPSCTDLDFAYWLDAEGNKVEDETEITSSLMLGAYYKETAKDPSNFKTDNWATVAAQCASMSKFVKAYLDTSFTGTEDEAKEIIIAEIQKNAKAVLADKESDKTLFKSVTVTLGANWTDTVDVRLIDVGKDVAADGSTKPLFTWEFASSIDVGCYSQNGNSHWAEINAAGELTESCLLRENCNKALLLKLPVSIVDALVPTKKVTPFWNDGRKPDITTTDLMWPLTLIENGLTAGTQVFSKQEGTYTFYAAMDGQKSQLPNSKFYFGYNGKKQYVVDPKTPYKPTLNYPLWTRTCYDTARMYMWNPDDYKTHTVYSNNGWAIAPAFCF